ncbi:MAG: hypothetical protein HY868_20545 [Chloroflexi bacterium]|nr:hypothetical protein [Chloroflexota bacterium]
MNRNQLGTKNEFEKLESALIRAGATIAYPATPALATRVRAALETRQSVRVFRLSRRAFTLIAALVLAIAILLAFPDAREALAQWLGLRTVRIIPVTLTPTVSITQTPSSSGTRTPSGQCCETILADAQAQSRFKILLPASRLPTRVYLQSIPDFGAQQVILVFDDANAPAFTLYQATNFLYGKLVSGGTVIEETSVKGRRALWLSGAPHLLVTLDATGKPRLDSARSVNANTLAWEVGEVTYRLETPLSKDAAIRFAESLQ